MNKILTPEQTKIILSMGQYWEEVSKRENNQRIMHEELQNLKTIISNEQILFAIKKLAEIESGA